MMFFVGGVSNRLLSLRGRGRSPRQPEQQTTPCRQRTHSASRSTVAKDFSVSMACREVPTGTRAHRASACLKERPRKSGAKDLIALQNLLPLSCLSHPIPSCPRLGTICLMIRANVCTRSDVGTHVGLARATQRRMRCRPPIARPGGGECVCYRDVPRNSFFLGPVANGRCAQVYVSPPALPRRAPRVCSPARPHTATAARIEPDGRVVAHARFPHTRRLTEASA